MPPVIINQGMKRQPMAVYRIREILSDSDQDRDYPQNECVGDDNNQLQIEGDGVPDSSSRPPSNCQLSHSSEAGARRYEDGIPVEDFLTKEQCHINITEQ